MAPLRLECVMVLSGPIAEPQKTALGATEGNFVDGQASESDRVYAQPKHDRLEHACGRRNPQPLG